MNVRRVDPARSRIMLVGVDAYTDPSIPDEPAIANNITDFAAVLTDPALGGFAPEHLLVAPPGAGVEQVGNLLVAAAAEAEDLLLFYYAGHGFPTSRRADLHLSLAGTRADQLAFTALPFDAVRDAFLDSRAGSRMVILDCCYSGKAIGRTLGESEADVMEQLDVAGTYTLTASPATRPAKAALPGERHTAFTGRLLELLRSGTPQAGPDLSLGDIYRHLWTRLKADGLPLPQQRGTENGDRLALTPNPAYRKPVPPAVVQSVPLPGDLRSALASRYPRIRAAAVAELAEWLDDADPRRVRTALRELGKIAATEVPEVAGVARAALRHRFDAAAVLTVPDDGEEAADDTNAAADSEAADSEAADSEDVAEIAKAAKAGKAAKAAKAADALARPPSPSPDHAVDTAELLARQIAAASSRAETLAQVAKVVAVNDPRRAARLIYEAALTARTVNDESTLAELLVRIARAASIGDPGRASDLIREAQTIARAIPDEHSKGWALAAIAEAVAATEPNRAVGIARPIADAASKISALVRVAAVIGAKDPRRAARLVGEAEAIAHESIEESAKVESLATVAIAMAASDPERALELIVEAETVAAAIADEHAKGYALADIAQAAAAIDPGRAEAIAYAVTDHRAQAWALILVVEATAAGDPQRAGALANSIGDASLKARALAKCAEALTPTDPDEAESIAYTIADESWKARALAMVAEAAFAADPDRAARLVAAAEGIGHAITDSSEKAWVLTEIAMVRLRWAS